MSKHRRTRYKSRHAKTNKEYKVLTLRELLNDWDWGWNFIGKNRDVSRHKARSYRTWKHNRKKQHKNNGN